MNDYQKRLDEFMRVKYKEEKPLPSGMYGHMGWYMAKKREFDALEKESVDLQQK